MFVSCLAAMMSMFQELLACFLLDCLQGLGLAIASLNVANAKHCADSMFGHSMMSTCHACGAVKKLTGLHLNSSRPTGQHGAKLS